MLRHMRKAFNEGQRITHEDWALDGHGLHCGYQAIPYDDYGTQLDPTTPSSTIIENKVTVSIQTDPSNISTLSTTSATQTESPTLTVDATSQTDPAFIENETKVNMDNTDRPFCKLNTTYDGSPPTPPIISSISLTPVLTQNEHPELPKH